MPIVTVETFISTKFDYLILGGGTSGLALAARLSENRSVTVGVIEAGGHHKDAPDIDIPGMMGSTIANPNYDWTFFSTPQVHANNRSVLQPRGKGLGGTSLINFLGMFRPTKDELDAIEMLGNPTWNWKSMLHYMKKSETTFFNGPTSVEEGRKFAAIPIPEAHGTNGPLYKCYPTILNDIHAKFLDTAEKLGIPRNEESSYGMPIGGTTAFITVDPRTAARSHSASAYYQPNSARENLLVLTHAQVTKILFEQQNSLQRAIGTEFLANGKLERVLNVTCDVIISAGTFQTPQILELSGIGNPDILSKYGIDTIVDLPGVGENLQDHVLVPTIVEIDKKYESLDVLLEEEGLKWQKELYKQQQGFLATGGSPAFAFVPAIALGNEKEVKAWQEKANNEILKAYETINVPGLKSGLKKQYEFQRKWFADTNHPVGEILYIMGHIKVPKSVPTAGKRYATFLSALMHPYSRGTVHITSADPLAPPAIDPNYLAKETDLNVLARVVEFALKLQTSSPLKDAIKAHVIPPQSIVDADGTERMEHLKEFVKENCGPVYHPVGTASMLPREDGGVVDHELKVYGTANLRVVDLSIIPLELGCHTQSIAYAVGEKAADIIKSSWKGAEGLPNSL